MPPLISVIIPTYNRYDFLLDAINSVKNQSYQNFEIIVVDDGSIDKTCRLQSNNSVVCLHQENKGPAAARNAGAKIARGKWLAFLDSDDTWDENKLQTQINYADKNPDYNIFYSDEFWIRNGKKVNKKNIHKKYHGWIYPHCLKLCFVGFSSLLIKKSTWFENGGLDESFPVAEDYDLWLRLSAKYKFFYIDEKLVTRTGGRDDQLSFSFKGIDKFRIIAMLKMLESKNLNEELREITCNELVKKCKIYLSGCKKRDKFDEISFCENILKTYE